MNRLRVGDWIRFVRLPPEIDEPGYAIAPATRRLFERLIESRRPRRFARVDPAGLPWIDLRRRTPSGRLVYESLAIAEEGWVRAGRRSPSSPRP